uniref:Uncharacterized protein n=1 Tax=viral metagenome TaxID=1070528 RepID=A0A6H1ZWM5_9ZZZZ
MERENEQHIPGRTSSCCASMRMALSSGYIRKGYFWHKPDPPVWFPWCFKIRGKGFCETSPIHYCPFCGADLDSQ